MTAMKNLFPPDYFDDWNKDKNKPCCCGESGDCYSKMLQCQKCKQWFHDRCIRCFTFLEYELLHGDHFYRFICSKCNEGKESIKRLTMTMNDVVRLTLYNLAFVKPNVYFDIGSVVQFIRTQQNNFKVSDLHLKTVSQEELYNEIKAILNKNNGKFYKKYKSAKGRNTLWAVKKICAPKLLLGLFENDDIVMPEGSKEEYFYHLSIQTNDQFENGIKEN
ncbi:uncharacterized protein B4U79_18844, partial [Dinothrombium tinctorium]